MKKVFSILLAAVLMLGVFTINIPVSKAASTDDLVITITPSPSGLVEGGEVTFTVKAQNKTADKKITDLVVDFGETTCTSINGIDAGKTVTKPFKMDVATDKLDTDLTFSVNYSMDDGSNGAVTVTTKVAKKEPTVNLKATCNVDRTASPKGGKINFTFTLENAGEAKLTNIAVSLPPINSSKKISIGFTSLTPGQEKTFNYEYTMGSEDISVTPTIKFTANEKDQTKTLAVKKLVIANYDLTMNISADNTKPAAGEGVVFTVNVENTGNAKMNKIKIFDHLQQEIKSDFSLMPGKKITFTTEKYTFTQTTDVKFSLTTEDNDGQTYSDDSQETIKISIPVDKTKVKVDLKAEASLSTLTEPGPVTFKVTVINSGAYPLSDIVITEDKLGEFDKLDSLEAGEKYFEKEYTVEEAGTYNFKVTAKDADGNEYSAAAEPVEIKMEAAAAPSDPLAEATDVPTTDKATASTKGGDTLGTIIIIMVVIAVLIIGVVIALVVMVRKEKRNPSRPGGSAGSGKPGTQAKPSAPKTTVKYRNKNNF